MRTQFDNPVWIAGSVSAFFNCLASMVFFSYCFYRIIMDSCGLRSVLSRRYSRFKRQYHDKSKFVRFQLPDVPAKRLIFLSRSMRFLITLQLAAMAMSFDKIIGFFEDTRVSRFWCVVQALCLNIFGLEMHIWSLIISIYLFYSSMILPRKLHGHKKWNWGFEVMAHVVAHSVTAVLVAIPYFFDVIGSSGNSGWCWIDTSKELGALMVYVSFYAPVWLMMILNSLIYNAVLFAVFRSLKNTNSLTSYFKNEKHLKLTLKLILYPGISLVVWIIPTINRILNPLGIYYTPLIAAHSYCICLNGFLNVVVFFFNPLKHIKLLFMIFCCPLYIMKKRKESAEFRITRARRRGVRSQSMLDKVEFLARHGDDEYEDTASETDELDDKQVALMEQNMLSEEDDWECSESADDPRSIDSPEPAILRPSSE